VPGHFEQRRRSVVIDPDGEGSFDLLASYGGGDLSLNSMTFQNSGGGGILIAVPDGDNGRVNVTHFKVTLADNGLEGISINDCDGPDLDTCGGSDAALISRSPRAQFPAPAGALASVTSMQSGSTREAMAMCLWSRDKPALSAMTMKESSWKKKAKGISTLSLPTAPSTIALSLESKQNNVTTELAIST